MKMTLIADIFPKLRTRKTWFNNSLKSPVSQDPLISNIVWDLTPLRLEPHHLCHIHWSLLRQLRRKKYPLVIYKISGLFVKTLNAAHKYSLLYREKLKKLIQMQLSMKQKLFFQFVAVFLKSRLISEHFQKENDTHSWYISEITNSEKRG